MNEAQRNSFLQGTETRAYRFMGCHKDDRNGRKGYVFRVWAPNAESVHVAGSFNNWHSMPMDRLEGGIFELLVPQAREWDVYQYAIVTPDGKTIWKADPYGFHMSQDGFSQICNIEGYTWKDGIYRRAQARKKLLQNPINIYELHIGSWRRKADGDFYTYAELAEVLVPYVKEMGYTHIELMSIAEYTDWCYGVIGHFAPSSRYGTPQELMAFVDACHQEGIGVLMNWVCGHFSDFERGLAEFDGTCCYEYFDPEFQIDPQHQTWRFDVGRFEVRSFLLSNAIYWIDEYHLDGLRIDGVASMIYLQDKENPDTIAFLRQVNQATQALRTNIIMAAEDSSAYPNLTGSVEEGGLGFTMKWNTDWVDDMQRYLALDPVYRKYHHDNLTYSMEYAFTENFILPIPHDMAMSGNGSMIEQIAGYYDDKFANLRTFYGFQMSHPGKKLNFMGNEFAQFSEWDADGSLDWLMTEYDRHGQMQRWVKDLNHYYLDCKALWQNDGDETGFQWIQADDTEHSVLAYRRIDRKGREVIVICNFCPVFWDHHRIGLPKKGCYIPVLCSDSLIYGGTGVPLYAVRSEPIPNNGQMFSAEFMIPPLSVTFYEME